MTKWLLLIVCMIIIFLSIGFIYEKIKRNSQAIEYPSYGKIINLDDTGLHYIKRGEGQETVVFSSGNGTPSPYIDMYHLQSEVSELTETIVYERPGYGWSDVTSSERSVDNIVNEMEVVLTDATKNDSFIFVGHSMAALEIFYYAQKHPEKVKGIVLIDGVNPSYASQMKNSLPLSIRAMKLFKDTGVIRLLSNFDSVKEQLNQNKDIPNYLKDLEVELTLHNMWNSTMIAERKRLSDNGHVVMDGNDLGDIGLVIFSAEANPMEGWKQSQDELASWSEESKQIWVDTDNHFIHYEQPEKIIEEIKALLN